MTKMTKLPKLLNTSSKTLRFLRYIDMHLKIYTFFAHLFLAEKKGLVCLVCLSKLCLNCHFSLARMYYVQSTLDVVEI